MNNNAPNRHPVIRFFVSSTFSDMERERDIIRAIFKELKPKYKNKGWQLDLVDLRWGINPNEGLDNKTMSICLGEIEHCQTVSPKPNFIMLVGKHFGWAPLPETIKLSEYDQLFLTAKQKSLFDEWYVRDNNYSDQPRFILKSREGKYVDNKTFHDQVEEPLSRALMLLTKGLSATQMEILKGIDSTDAKEHIIAYVRSLRNAPKAYKSQRIREKISQRLLRHIIKKDFGKHHYFAPTFKYSNYIKGLNDKNIYDNLKTNIIDVIEREISSCNRSPHDYEVHEHFEHAHALAKGFIGRESEIKQILDYINNPEPDSPLWIHGPAGVGKSALVSKIAELNGFNKTTIIFCGLTEKSSNPYEIKNTIHERTKPLCVDSQKIKVNGKLQPHVRPFPWLIRHSKTRHLFIIDNAGGIKDANLQYIFTIQREKYAPGIKIIFTSTTGDAFVPLEGCHELSLSSFSFDESKRIIKSMLEARGRTLTNIQQKTLENQLINTELTGLFLRLLSLHLSSVRSWESLPKIPLDALTLSSTLIRQILSEDHKYGYSAAPLVITALTIDRIGLNDDEILDLLFSDSNFLEKFSQSSFHTLSDNGVPPIIWARLYSRLSPFLTNVYNKYGTYYSLSIKEIREYIYSSFVATPDGAKLLYNCWSFYKDNPQNKHLASQTLFLGYETIKIHKTLYGFFDEYYTVLSEIIEKNFLDLSFLSTAYFIDRNDTLGIIDKVLSEILSNDSSKQVLQWSLTLSGIRKKLGNLSVAYSQEATLLALGEVPDCYSCKIIPNQFSHLSWDSSIINTLSYPTHFSRLTADGKNVILVKNESNKSFVYSYSIEHSTPTEHLIFEFEDSIRAIDISSDAETICVCGHKKTHIYTNQKKYKYDYLAESVQVSSDGQTILLANEEEFKILNLLKPTATKEVEFGGVLSKDGKCVWAFTKETVLSKISLSPYVEETFYYQGNSDLFGQEKIVVACSKKYCVISCFGGVRYSEWGLLIQHDEEHPNLLMKKIPLHIHERYGHVWINAAEDQMLIYERANLILWSLNPLKVTACIEVDNIIDVTPDFSFLLTRQGQIIDFRQLLRSNKFLAYAEIGINSINYSQDNNSFIISVGKDCNEEYYPKFHSITKINGQWTVNSHLMPECNYISASAVSHKGDIYLLCKNGDDNSIEIRKTSNNQLLAKTNALPDACTAIGFTRDDQHIVAGIGYYEDDLSLSTPTEYHYYVIDRKGNIVKDINRGDKGDICNWLQTIESKYIVTEKLEIIDINNGSIDELKDEIIRITFPWTLFREWHFRFMMHPAISKSEYDHSSFRVSNPCIAVNGSSVFYSTKDNVIEYQLEFKKRIPWNINESVICASNIGLYTLNEKNELYFRDYRSKTPKFIEAGVQYAAVSPDNKMLYVSLKNGVLIFKKDFINIGVAYLGSSYDMHVTNNGLVGSNREGEVFYYDLSTEINDVNA